MLFSIKYNNVFILKPLFNAVLFVSREHIFIAENYRYSILTRWKSGGEIGY